MNVLIVDDEVPSVRALRSAINWESLGITKIYSAYSSKLAKKLILESAIDILITDIEMPHENGIELIAWVRENKPSVETIILTCHDDFVFAKEAIRLDTFEYCLKPLDIPEIENSIKRLVKKIKMTHQMQKNSNLGEYWVVNQGVVEKEFFRYLIEAKHPVFPEDLLWMAKSKNISFDPDSLHTIVSVYHICQSFFRRDIDISSILYGIENVAKEILAHDLSTNRILQINDHIVFICTETDMHIITNRCDHLVQVCQSALQCRVCCFISTDLYWEDIPHRHKQIHKVATSKEDDVSGVFIIEKSDWDKKDNDIDTQISMEQPETIIGRVKDYIQYNIGRDITRDEIAQAVNLNADYLSRLFRKRIGMTLKTYIIQEKMELACLFLREQKYSISEIVELLGYNNHSHFSTQFKKYTGVAPREYQCHKSNNGS